MRTDLQTTLVKGPGDLGVARPLPLMAGSLESRAGSRHAEPALPPGIPSGAFTSASLSNKRSMAW